MLQTHEIRLNNRQLFTGTDELDIIFNNLSGDSFRAEFNQSFNNQQQQYRDYLQLMQKSLGLEKWQGRLELALVGKKAIKTFNFS